MRGWVGAVVVTFVLTSLAGVETLRAGPGGDGDMRLAQAEGTSDGTSSKAKPSGDKQKAQKVLRLLKQGKKAAKAGNYEDAYNLFKQANDIYPRPGLQFRLGQLADRIGDTEAALMHFEKYLEVAPPESEASDDTKRNLKQARTRVDEIRAQMPATLEITSTPEGADVYLGSTDGDPLGQTPLTHEYDGSGQVEVIVKTSGYEPATERVNASRGSTSQVAVTLSERQKMATDAEQAVDEPARPEPAGRRGAGAFPAIGWGAAGVGVLGVGTGIVFHALHQQTDNEVTRYDLSQQGNTEAELADLEDEAATQFDAALVGYSAGGAFLVSGATVLVYHYVIRGNDKEKAAIHPTLKVGHRGAVGGVQFRF